MSSKSRYILAAKQLAYHNELKKSLDANTGAYIKRISLADYMRMLIDEGVLTEPPPAVNWAEVAAASQESGVPFNVQKSAMADWAREALTLIKKDYGVTGGSNTPGYDTKRGIFIDNGGGYAGDASRYTWGVQVSGRDGEASTNQGGGLFSGLSRGSGLQEDGSYDSPWVWDLGLQALSQSNNSIGLAEQRLQQYNDLKARSDNVWGPAENYVPIPLGFYSKTPGKLQTQAEAQKDPLTQILSPKPEALGTFQEWNDMRDTTLLEQAKNRFGLKNDVNSITNKILSVDGHYAYKNIFSADERPDLSSLESYRAARDSGQLEAMDRYATMVQKNNGVFDRRTRKIKDDTNLGFTSFTEYNQLTPQQLQIADQRVRGYNDYYVAKALEAKAKDNYESSAKTKGRQKALGSLAIGALTGGIFALGGAGSIASSISQSLGGVLQASTIAAAAGGAAAGGLQGGLKGALTGGLTAGLGAAAGSAIGDYLGGSEALAGNAGSAAVGNLGSSTAFNQAGLKALTPESFLSNLGEAAESGTSFGVGSSAAFTQAGIKALTPTSFLPNLGGGLLSDYAAISNNSTLNAITPESFLPNLGETGATTSPTSSLAGNIGDQAGSQITSQLNSAAAGEQQQPQQQQPQQQQPSIGGDTQPTTNIPQLSRSGGLFGASKYVGTSAPAQAASLNSNYNSGIRLNTSAAPPTSELGGLLTQLRN